MKLWMVFVLLAVVSWGAYVPTIHAGQMALAKGALKAFLCVGLAYFLVAVLVPSGLLAGGLEPATFNKQGVSISMLAGTLGALGALGVILALKSGGSPMYVAPLVFAGAPLVNVAISMYLHPPKSMPQALFYVGILMAALGAGLVLRYKPA